MRGAVCPPFCVARIRHGLGETCACLVHFGEHDACVVALGGGGIGNVAAVEFFYDAGGLVGKGGGECAVALGDGGRAGDAVCAEVSGELHEKRDFVRFQGFKHGEHIAAALGVQKIIAVGYALGDALQGLKFAKIVSGEQLAHFVVGNAGVN